MIDQVAIRTGSETILVVEDDPGVQQMVQRGLERLGYRVLLASHPQEATLIAGERDRSIDLLMSDVLLPAKSGPDLAREIRRTRPELGVLFMSGYTDEAVGDQHPEETGSVGFLQKPFSIQTLADTVRDALDSGTEGRGGI